MRREVRLALSIGLMVAAWGLFLASPFLFLGPEASEDYLEGLLSAALLWVPLVAATVVTFVTPRRVGILVACVVLGVPLAMVLSYGSGIGVVWSGVGLLVLGANIVRPRDPVSARPGVEGPPAVPDLSLARR